MTFAEQQQLERLVFNQAEEYGWKSNDGNWTICACMVGDIRVFQIHRKLNPRPDPSDARWHCIQARIETLEKAAAIANELARAEVAA